MCMDDVPVDSFVNWNRRNALAKADNAARGVSKNNKWVVGPMSK